MCSKQITKKLIYCIIVAPTETKPRESAEGATLPPPTPTKEEHPEKLTKNEKGFKVKTSDIFSSNYIL